MPAGTSASVDLLLGTPTGDQLTWTLVVVVLPPAPRAYRRRV